MRQIGGDYLFARFEPDARRPRRFHLLIIDVPGHGIAAALTVNRLYGEIERLFAENPETGPGEVLAALNRYVHLTLSRHSIYATACVRIDTERDLLEYAWAGIRLRMSRLRTGGSSGWIRRRSCWCLSAVGVRSGRADVRLLRGTR